MKKTIKTTLYLLLFCSFSGTAQVQQTELLQGLSIQLYDWFGADVMSVAFLSLAGIGVLSSLLANIPVVAASLIMTKGYLVAAEAVPELALAPGFLEWPAATIPVTTGSLNGFDFSSEASEALAWASWAASSAKMPVR